MPLLAKTLEEATKEFMKIKTDTVPSKGKKNKNSGYYMYYHIGYIQRALTISKNCMRSQPN